eukprot:TRINITY_DN12886_c0_g1_i1.p1 TRINITY_DN12886_c0_g1~~TRINITY_DN12886_c0_g1_i1.p1  ORF type:complete len:318 (+),score=78.18 TRINITY_DN12886_c0_g1_i1:1125-2078(+)
MPRAAATIAKKQTYFDKLNGFMTQFPRVLVVDADNVTSRQMQQIRIALRGKGELLMGKNTMMRKAMREFGEKNPKIMNLLPYIKTNIGLVFTGEDCGKIRDLLTSNRVATNARAGLIAPNSVVVPKQQTALEPTQTSFFQALNIATKINKGAIEILNDVPLIQKGDKVGASEAALLNKLGIRPFFFGLDVSMVYDDGTVYEPRILDLTDADLIKSFSAGVQRIASIGLEVGFPTIASIPHSISNSFKRLLAVSVETEYEIAQSKQILAYLKDPKAFAAAAPVAAAPAAAATTKPAEAPKPKKKETSSDGDMGLGLFD